MALTVASCSHASCAQAAVIDVLLETPHMASPTVHTGQLLGERSTTGLTVKATAGKVQKRALAPDVQVAHTALFPIMKRRRYLSASRTDGHAITMNTVKVQNRLLPATFDSVLRHNELGQIQQLANGESFDFVDNLPHRHLGCAGSVLQRLDNIGQQGYTNHVWASFGAWLSKVTQFCTKVALLSSLPHYSA
jgi:hypothetical protein